MGALTSRETSRKFKFKVKRVLSFHFRCKVLKGFAPMRLVVVAILVYALVYAFLNVLVFLVDLCTNGVLTITIAVVDIITLFVIRGVCKR